LPEAERTAKADMSRAVSADPHAGHASAGEEPFTFTSSSKR
jgi:hypothetical protein